jgi:hypothetical protein
MQDVQSFDAQRVATHPRTRELPGLIAVGPIWIPRHPLFRSARGAPCRARGNTPIRGSYHEPGFLLPDSTFHLIFLPQAEKDCPKSGRSQSRRMGLRGSVGLDVPAGSIRAGTGIHVRPRQFLAG